MEQGTKQQIVAVLDAGRDLTLATVRDDLYPQATTVSYVNDGTEIFFVCGQQSQKARNLARNDRVSLTIDLPYKSWQEIRGLSMSGRAQQVSTEADKRRAESLFQKKFAVDVSQFSPEDMQQVALYKITPEVISLLDYTKGFGHTDLVRAGDLNT